MKSELTDTFKVGGLLLFFLIEANGCVHAYCPCWALCVGVWGSWRERSRSMLAFFFSFFCQNTTPQYKLYFFTISIKK